MTVNKVEQKIYYSHSGYPGGLKEVPAKRLRANKSDWMIREAVLRMLAKNKLRARRAKKLRIYRDAAGIAAETGRQPPGLDLRTRFSTAVFNPWSLFFCERLFSTSRFTIVR